MRWFRGLWRSAVLIFTLSESLVRYWLLQLRTEPTQLERAEWLHRSCRRVLRRLSFDMSLSGPLPRNGLIVSNHLGYLDILFYGAAFPCVFVAKSEVRSWPIFGALAAAAGTVFLERGNAASAAAAARTMESILARNLPVLLFPEGTSSDGSTVLRFHSALFEPAIRNRASVTAAAVRYASVPGLSEQELCYYGDVRLGSHLFNTLSLRQVSAEIRFASTASIPRRPPKRRERKLAGRPASARTAADRRTSPRKASVDDSSHSCSPGRALKDPPPPISSGSVRRRFHRRRLVLRSRWQGAHIGHHAPQIVRLHAISFCRHLALAVANQRE